MSLYKRPDSRIWWAAITLPDGGRVCRSSGTANRKEAREWLDHVRADLWRVHRLGERATYTWQDAVVRWCEEKADKATAHEDRVKFQWLDCAPPQPAVAYDHAGRDSGDWQGQGGGEFPRHGQSLSRPPACRIEAGSRSVAMDRESASRHPLPGGEAAGALAYQGGGHQAVERVATASETAHAFCARDGTTAGQRARFAMVCGRSWSSHGMGSCRRSERRRGDRRAVE